jgi:alkylation response protein AidB-like acyl-CoA dehydrogenase
VDFELSKEQLDIQQAARQFAETELNRDYMLELDRGHKYPWEAWKKAGELGFIAINYPEKYGGGGYGLMERVLVIEEFCRQGAGIGNALVLSNFGCRVIANHGTEEQKKKYLEPMCQGKAITFIALTEPDRGSDLVSSHLTTNAVKEGGSYVINGSKTFITNGSTGDFGPVLCQTDFKVSPPYRGHSMIIVEKGTPGFEATDLEKMGMHSSPTCQVSFNNVKVDRGNLIGEEGKGFYYAVEFLNEARIETATMGLGIGQGSLDRAITYARSREAYGRKISEFQAISHRLAEMATKIEAVRGMIYKAAWGVDRGKADPKLCSMAKWYSARMACEVADEAINILGGHGYMLENEVERFYRDAKSTELVEGTRDIHKNNIARFLLGKQSQG